MATRLIPRYLPRQHFQRPRPGSRSEPAVEGAAKFPGQYLAKVPQLVIKAALPCAVLVMFLELALISHLSTARATSGPRQSATELPATGSIAPEASEDSNLDVATVSLS